MRGARSQSVQHYQGVVGVLAVQESLGAQPGYWTRSLFFQGLTEDAVARDLANWDCDALQLLCWFERQLISTECGSVGTAVTHGTVEEHEQLSEPVFTAVADWLIPRFWSDPTDLEHARAVVSRLREAYNMNVLPESWFAWQAESVPDWATDSGCPSSLRSPAAVAYWAYYLDTKDSFTPEQRLWHLSVLARWSPGHALIHAFSDMKEHFQSIRDDREDQSTQDLQQALNFWLCKDNGGTLEQVVTKEFNDAAAQLKAIRNDATNSAMKPYESLLGKWCISTGWEESKSYHDYYHLQCPMYRDQIVSTYFSDLVCWPVEEGTKRFPVASFNSFAFDRPRDIWLRYAVRLEEQFVRRLVDLLIDHQAIGTGLTRDTIIKNLRHQKSFRFSASQNTFNQLYNQALNEKIKQVSIERGFDRAWKLGCAAITTMYDISAVANAPVVAQLKGLENPAAPSSF